MASPILHVGKTFESFAELEKAMTQYEAENNMKFVTGSSNSIKKANERLAQRGVPPSEHYKASLKLVYANFVCKFGGPRRTGSGKGERVLQSTFKIGCPFKFHITASKTHLVIDSFITKHENYNCTPEELKIIRECRIVDANDQAAFDILCQANVRLGKIKMLFRDTPSGNLTARDIANLKAKRKRIEANGRSELQILEDTLCQILEADPGAYIQISKDEDNHLSSLFIQTSKMRKNVADYGMVLLFDHTYKINKNRMPVSILKVMDGNGVGRCAGIGYVANEEKGTLVTIVGAFAESVGDEIADKVQTVVIDKDWSEAGAIREKLPKANIQLCDFHVGNTFKTKSAGERKEVKAILDDLRYCEENTTFEQLCVDLRKVASKDFWKYFEKNWVNCPLAWSYRDKKNSPNLGNTTNNRLENFNGKAKFVTNADTPLHESVKMLLQLVLNREEDALYAEICSSVKHMYHTRRRPYFDRNAK